MMREYKDSEDSAQSPTWLPYLKYGSIILLAAFAVWILVVALAR